MYTARVSQTDPHAFPSLRAVLRDARYANTDLYLHVEPGHYTEPYALEITTRVMVVPVGGPGTVEISVDSVDSVFVVTGDRAALELYGVGRQWMWKFQHPAGAREINELHVPVGRPMKVVLASEDVIHSFFIPNLRFKQDMVPGHEIPAWFKAIKPGKYEIPCAELCGFGHSGMRGWIYVHSAADYQKWAAENLQAAAAPAADAPRPEAKQTDAAKPAAAGAPAGGKAKR